MHVTESDLRAYLDGELPAAEAAAAEHHLAACAECTHRLAEARNRAERVAAHLAVLAPETVRAPRRAADLVHAFKQRERKEPVSMLRALFARRSLWAGLAVVLALALSFSFAPVRTWAGQFLGLLRVQQVVVLPIDDTSLVRLEGDSTMADQIGRLFADSVTFSREPADPVEVDSLAAASQAAGFAVRGLGAAGEPSEILVQGGAAFEVVVDRDRAQGLLDEAGRSDLQLPASLDGARISVDIPDAVAIAYGECRRGGNEWEGSRNCVLLGQVPSPSVNMPPDVDLAQLAELGLQFTGMSEAEARQVSQAIDWTTTLVMPIPQGAAAYEQVNVDGVTGTVIYRSRDDGGPQRYALIWVKDGIVYSLTGYATVSQAVDLANSIE